MERRYHLVLDAKEAALVTLAWVLLNDMARGQDTEAAVMVRSYLFIQANDPSTVERVYKKIGKLLDAALVEEMSKKLITDLKGRVEKHGD